MANCLCFGECTHLFFCVKNIQYYFQALHTHIDPSMEHVFLHLPSFNRNGTCFFLPFFHLWSPKTHGKIKVFLGSKIWVPITPESEGGNLGSHVFSGYEMVLKVLNRNMGELEYAGEGPLQNCYDGMNMVNLVVSKIFTPED